MTLHTCFKSLPSPLKTLVQLYFLNCTLADIDYLDSLPTSLSTGCNGITEEEEEEWEANAANDEEEEDDFAHAQTLTAEQYESSRNLLCSNHFGKCCGF